MGNDPYATTTRYRNHDNVWLNGILSGKIYHRAKIEIFSEVYTILLLSVDLHYMLVHNAKYLALVFSSGFVKISELGHRCVGRNSAH